MLENVSRMAVAGQVIEQLRQMMDSGALQPGQLLPDESELAKRLAANRQALREALRALEHAGLLQALPDGTLRVTDVPPVLNMGVVLKLYAHWEVTELRKIVECAGVNLAVRRARPDELQALRSAHITMCQAIEDNQRFVLADFAFHRAVAEASGNSMLDSLLQNMWATASGFNLELLISRPERELVVAQHEQVLLAIEAGNAEAATDALARHLDSMVDIMRRNYAPSA